MMKSGFWLTDEQWSVIEPLLPKNAAGARSVDDRQRRFTTAFTDGRAGVSGTAF